MTDVLYVTTYPPSRRELGGAAWVDTRVLGALRSTGDDIQVAVVTAEDGFDADGQIVNRVGHAPLSVRGSLRRLTAITARMLVSARPYQDLKFAAFDDVAAASRRLRGLARGRTVITSGLPALLYVERAGVPIHAHIAHNLEWKVAREAAPAGLRILAEATRLRRLELHAARAPERLLCLSRDDVAALRARGLVAHHLDIPLVARDVPDRGGRGPELAVGFLGTLTWPPNVSALDVLRKQILPALQTEQIETCLVIAGRGSEGLTHTRAGVIGLGPIHDVARFYEMVDLVVVPRLGPTTGVSIKVLEATEYGRMAVVSRSVAEAITDDPPWLVADGVDEMIAAVQGWPNVDGRDRLLEWRRRRSLHRDRTRQILLDG